MLSKKSIKRLRAVKAAILAEPEFYNQARFPHEGDKCETPCCIAGWAVYLDDPDKYVSLLRSRREVKWIHRMADVLGINTGQALSLFANFNAEFDGDEYAAGTLPYALLGAAKIEHFIATEGRE